MRYSKEEEGGRRRKGCEQVRYSKEEGGNRKEGGVHLFDTTPALLTRSSHLVTAAAHGVAALSGEAKVL